MAENLIGQTFHRLTVIDFDTASKPGRRKWICQCSCGNIKSVQGSNLKNGGTKSCGCLQKEKVVNNLINQQFGRLTVIKDSGKRSSKRNIIWLCQCDCGNQCEVSGTNLLCGTTYSCGCLKQSHGEFEIEQLLQENNIQYQKEYVFKDLITPKGGYARFDFAILDSANKVKYLIEYDGCTHDYSHICGWNTKEKVEYQQLCDQLKTDYCKIHNIPLIRISYKQDIKIEDLIIKGAF